MMCYDIEWICQQWCVMTLNEFVNNDVLWHWMNLSTMMCYDIEWICQQWCVMTLNEWHWINLSTMMCYDIE